MKKLQDYTILISAGIITGIINGLFGGGGGMVLVPMLSILYGLENKKSHATALLIILPISIVSSIMYAIFGNFDLKIGVPVTIGVVLGGIVGAILLKKLSSFWVAVVFTIIMVFAGAKLLFL